MTAFIQSSPGLIPTLADSSLIPTMCEEFGLSNVMEEDPDLLESNNEQAEIEKVANMSSSSIFMNETIDTKRAPYRGSIWSSSSTSVDTFVYGPRRSSLPPSKSLSSTSGTSIDSVLMSPLAANRAIYRKSLLRHSVVSDTQMGSIGSSNDSKMIDLRSSTTSASLIMKRGTLFANTKSLMGGAISEDVTNNKNNATIDTVQSVVTLGVRAQ